MQELVSNFGAIVLWVGAVDAAVILLLGIAAAFLYLFNVQAAMFYERIIPATSILIGTSVGAGVLMLVVRWLSGLF